MTLKNGPCGPNFTSVNKTNNKSIYPLQSSTMNITNIIVEKNNLISISDTHK